MPYHVAWIYGENSSAELLGSLLVRDDVRAVEVHEGTFIITMENGHIGPPETIREEPLGSFLYLIEGPSRTAITNELLYENVVELMGIGTDIDDDPDEEDEHEGVVIGTEDAVSPRPAMIDREGVPVTIGFRSTDHLPFWTASQDPSNEPRSGMMTGNALAFRFNDDRFPEHYRVRLDTATEDIFVHRHHVHRRQCVQATPTSTENPRPSRYDLLNEDP